MDKKKDDAAIIINRVSVPGQPVHADIGGTKDQTSDIKCGFVLIRRENRGYVSSVRV